MTFNIRSVTFFVVLLASVCVAEVRQNNIDRILSPPVPINREYTKSFNGIKQARKTDIEVVTTTASDGRVLQLATGEIRCRLWQNCIVYQDDRGDNHQWECTFDDDVFSGNIQGFTSKVLVASNEENMNEFLEMNNVHSGKSVLVMAKADIGIGEVTVDTNEIIRVERYGDGFTKGGVVQAGIRGSEVKPLKGVSRRLEEDVKTGSLNTLVVRVVANDSQPPIATALSEDIFNDPYCLKSQYAACSYGKLTIQEYEPGDGISNVPTVAPGIVEVNIQTNAIGLSKESIEDLAKAELNKLLDTDDPGSMFDIVMFCMPPGTGNWLAFARIGDWASSYNDDWCQSISSQMHEVGHSIGLHHSGENTGTDSAQEYGDQTGYMGFSYKSDDAPIMCFNPAKSFDLGWYVDKQIDLDPNSDLSQEVISFTLNGVADYGDMTAGRYIVVKIGNFFIGYNRKAGINQGVMEAGNQVTVIERLGSDADSKSKLAARLNPGDNFIIDITSIVQINIKFESIDGNDAVVGINLANEIAVCEGEYDAEIEITFITDRYPKETKWGITDSAGQFVFSKDGYNAIGTYVETVSSLCRGIQYFFVIEDQFGDGICCQWGEGNISGTYGDVELFNNIGGVGNTFTSQKIVSFTLPIASSTSSPTATPTSSPTATPTATPTAAPTAAPTARTPAPQEDVTEVTNGDNSNFLYRGKSGKDCSWVSAYNSKKNQDQQRVTNIKCMRRSDDIRVFKYCPQTCCDIGKNKDACRVLCGKESC